MARLVCLSIGLVASLALPFVVLVPRFGDAGWEGAGESPASPVVAERPCRGTVLLRPQLGLLPVDEQGEREADSGAAASLLAAESEISSPALGEANRPAAQHCSAGGNAGKSTSQTLISDRKLQDKQRSQLPAEGHPSGSRIVCDGDLCWVEPVGASQSEEESNRNHPQRSVDAPAVVLLMEPLAD